MVILKQNRLIVLMLLLAPACLVGMDASMDNTLAPLQALTNLPVSDTAVRNAFDESFLRVCGVVVASHNLYQIEFWLKSTEFEEKIDEHVYLIKEHINKICYKNYQLPHEYLSQHDKAVGQFFCCNFQVLDGAHNFLYKKVMTLASMVEMVILSGQRPEYFDDCQKLKNAVERRIMVEDMATSAKYAFGAAVAGAAFYLYSQVLR